MKFASTKRFLLLLFGIVPVLSISLGGLSRAFAATCTDTSNCKPYFKEFGADVSAGGWFANASGDCDTSPGGNYQDPDYSSASTPKNKGHGGIFTFANSASGNPPTATGGASSEFAAFSLGTVDSTTSAVGGFYSDGSGGAASKVNDLTFANTDTDPAAVWGGAFQSPLSGSQSPRSTCIPDYYDTKLAQGTPTIEKVDEAALSGVFDNIGSNCSRRFLATPPSADDPFDLSYLRDVTGNSRPINIPAGCHITVLVDGDAYIGENVIYDAHTADNVPKFSVIVRGNLYIEKRVFHLDGVYIAQPLPQCGGAVTTKCANDQVRDNTGTIWTCHPANNAATLDATIPNAECDGRHLVVNGALIAKEIILLRIGGDVTDGFATRAEDNAATMITNCQDPLHHADDLICNLGEVINYPPEVVIGGPFFNPTVPPSLKIQSLQSLPPLF